MSSKPSRSEANKFKPGRRRLGIVAVLASALIGLTVLPGGIATAAVRATPTSESSAAAAAGRDWLSGVLASGIPMTVFGSPSWGTTLDALTALAAVDSTDPLITTIWSDAVAHREAVLNDGTADIPGRLAQMILIAHTIDKDPRAVGAAPGADLVARLEATMTPSGSPDAGLYGSQPPSFDGVYRQGQALAALASAGATPDPLALAWLLDQQCVGAFDGSWMSYRADTSVPCISDSATWVGPDSNATALAISGLTEAFPTDNTAKDAVEAALTWLDSQQKPDGGWGGYPWADTDPNSTAVVIQALIAAGVHDDARFADKSASPETALIAFQLGASAPAEDRGAFTYPGTGNSPSEMATVQAVVAAAGYPVVFSPELPQPPATSTTTTTSVAPPTDGDTPAVTPPSGPEGTNPQPRPISLAG